MIYKNLLDLIGHTPMLEIQPGLLLKLERFNPGGSVKDRTALAMIEDAERRGVLPPGAAIIEPTSGNTGVGLAWIGRLKGYRVILTMPETMSIERRNLQRRITDEFIDWADEYLEDKLNQLFDRNDAYEAYKQQLSRSSEKFVSAQGFRQRLEDYCRYKGYTFMPLRMLRSESDAKRKVINRKENGVNKYYFYISDKPEDREEEDDLPM